MNCDEVKDRLSELVDGALDPAAEAGVREHLAGCAGCREELRALEETVKLLNGLAPVPVPPDLLPRIRERLAQKQGTGRILAFFGSPQFRIAAAACLVCAFCIYGYIYLEGPVTSRGSAGLGGETVQVAKALSKRPQAADALVMNGKVRPEETESDRKQKARLAGPAADDEYKHDAPWSGAGPELSARRGLANAGGTTATREEATAQRAREDFDSSRRATETPAPAVGGTCADPGLADRSHADAPAATASLGGRDIAKSVKGPSPAKPAPVVTEAESSEETGKIWGGDKDVAAHGGSPDETRLKLQAAGKGLAESDADDSAVVAAPTMFFAPASPAARPAAVEPKREAMSKETRAGGKPIDQLSGHEDSKVAASTATPGEQAASANEPVSQPCLTVTTGKHPDEVQAIIDKFAVTDEKHLEKALTMGSIVAADNRQSAKKTVSGEVSIRIKAADYPRLIEQLKTVGSVTDERPPAGEGAMAGQVTTARQPDTAGKTLLIRIRIVQK